MKNVYLALKLVGVALVAVKLVKEFKEGTLEISSEGLQEVVDLVVKK
jgi:hypothetical protein